MCKENKTDIWLDKIRASININKADISLLTWLIYHNDRIDIGYWPKGEYKSLTEQQTYHQS